MNELKLSNVTREFGGLVAVQKLDLQVGQGELFGLIGPNGAGKTTVFNLITGVYSPTHGSIEYSQKSIAGLAPHQIAACGIARTFQNIRLFAGLSVLDNVKLAMHQKRKQRLPSVLFRSSSFKQEEQQLEASALRLLEIFGLENLCHENAGNLPYGSQRRLEIARALATQPKLLLLDEPAAGMNPQESLELMKLIKGLRDEFKLGILLVEHNMRVVMGVCERIQVIVHGETIAMGRPEEIRRNIKVIEAYLGKDS